MKYRYSGILRFIPFFAQPLNKVIIFKWMAWKHYASRFPGLKSLRQPRWGLRAHEKIVCSRIRLRSLFLPTLLTAKQTPSDAKDEVRRNKNDFQNATPYSGRHWIWVCVLFATSLIAVVLEVICRVVCTKSALSLRGWGVCGGRLSWWARSFLTLSRRPLRSDLNWMSL